jgi:DNA segregation ATPase FtsK/SpoIIIE-like protein
VYIDEFDDINQHFRHYSRFPKVIQQLTSKNRHYGMTVWLSAQRPAQVPPTIRNNCREWVIFHLPGDTDRSLIQERSSIKEWEGMAIKDAVLNLPKLECFVINGRELFKKRI